MTGSRERFFKTATQTESRLKMENTLLALGGLYVGFKIFEIIAVCIITFVTFFIRSFNPLFPQR